MKQYKLKYRHGIDDLKGIYAFVANSQGDTSASNDINVYKASQGWMSFVFKCELTQEAIDKESQKRIKENEKYIEKLKKESKYGEEYEISISFEYNEAFDAPLENRPLSSYKIVDLNE